VPRYGFADDVEFLDELFLGVHGIGYCFLSYALREEW
jgi:hypothetical protein